MLIKHCIWDLFEHAAQSFTFPTDVIISFYTKGSRRKLQSAIAIIADKLFSKLFLVVLSPAKYSRNCQKSKMTKYFLEGNFLLN